MYVFSVRCSVVQFVALNLVFSRRVSEKWTLSYAVQQIIRPEREGDQSNNLLEDETVFSKFCAVISLEL